MHMLLAHVFSGLFSFVQGLGLGVKVYIGFVQTRLELSVAYNLQMPRRYGIYVVLLCRFRSQGSWICRGPLCNVHTFTACESAAG